MDRSPPIGGGQIMRFAASNRARSGFVAAGVAVAGALSGSAEASVIRPTASLPLIDVPYISPTGAGCFTLASVCVTPGAFVETSATSVFVPANGLLLPAVQDIVATATYDATLTPLVGNTVIGSVAFTGTVDETVLDRTSDSETGSFTTDITGLKLSGPLSLPSNPSLDGLTIVATLDTMHKSSGTTRITADGSVFKIDSFFDVFIDVSLPSAGLSKFVGPIPLVAVPEPSTWAMMLAGFAGLGYAGYRTSRRTAGGRV
jgi:hypothetical protein